MAAAGGDASAAIIRLSKEAKLIPTKGQSVPGVRFEPGSEGSELTWKLHVTGPDEYIVGTERRACPYAKRLFEVTVTCPSTYPFKAPTIAFAPNSILHPQVSTASGDLCADDVGKHFGPTKTMFDLGALVRQILAQPNLDQPLEAEIAAEMRDAKTLPAYEKKAAALGKK